MNILRAILFTLLFILFTEIIAVWVFVDVIWDIEDVILSRYDLINASIELLLVGLLIYKVDGKEALKPKSTKALFYSISLLGGISYVFVQTPLNVLFNALFGTEYSILYNFDITRIFTLNFLPFILFLPLAEELFFRQFIQNRLQKNYCSWISISLTALLFAFIHLDIVSAFLQGDELQFHISYIALFGGVISGILYNRSGSIGPSLIFHVFWNLGVLIF